MFAITEIVSTYPNQIFNKRFRLDKEKYLSELKSMLVKAEESESYSDVCISYADRLLSNRLPVIFDIKHFTLLIGINPIELTKMIFADHLFYKEQKVPKKSGGVRQLFMPAIQLKYIQRWILDNILSNIIISEYATGFCKNKSIKTNAKSHLGKECVLNMDIKDFFPSIKYETIFKIFAYYGYTKEVSYILAKLCTYKGSLPQGSPASPYLSNIACLKLDKRLSKLAEAYNADYSRYADDITFSGNKNVKDCQSFITKIVNDENFEINEKKSRFAYKNQRQEVTGLIVNDGEIRVNKNYKRKVYQEIYYCTKFGVSSHMKKIKCDKAFYKEYLYGKAFFINMIERNEGIKLFALLDKIQWDY